MVTKSLAFLSAGTVALCLLTGAPALAGSPLAPVESRCPQCDGKDGLGICHGCGRQYQAHRSTRNLATGQNAPSVPIPGPLATPQNQGMPRPAIGAGAGTTPAVPAASTPGGIPPSAGAPAEGTAGTTSPFLAGAGAPPPAAPAPAPAAPAVAALPAGLGGGLGGAETALNMLGDQGIIVIGPGRSGGDDVSVIRNFALNITDNNTATLQNRLIPIEYHRFFKSNRVYPGLPTRPDRYLSQVRPSLFSATRVQTDDDRYVFGFEYVLAERLSVLVRQAVVTIDQPAVDLQRGVNVTNLGGSHSGWGDLQISPKYLLFQSPDLTVASGVGVVVPLGNNSPYDQFGNQAVVLQPNILFLTKPTDRFYLQGGFEYDIPVTSSVNVSLFRYVLSGAYEVYRSPSANFLNAVYPMFEVHGSHLVGDFQQDTVNLTAGLRANVMKRAQLGIGYTFPVTEQQQFSNEVFASLNIFF